MAEARYRIGTVARVLGVSTHLIRAWERRYDVLEPDRSGGGARLYAPADVERLRLLKRAVDRGHAIGDIARLEHDELERLGGASSEPVVSEEARAFIDEFVDAVERFDGERAEELLARASIALSTRALVFDVLGPLLERVGNEWRSGRLCVASEHVASAIVRDALSGLLRRVPKNPKGELAVVATPERELHELGALLAAVTMAIRGYRVLYLGANLPASEITRAVRESLASIVALSLVSLEPELAVRTVRGLSKSLPEHVDIVLGGIVSERVREGVGARVLVPGSLAAFDHWLEARQER